MNFQSSVARLKKNAKFRFSTILDIAAKRKTKWNVNINNLFEDG